MAEVRTYELTVLYTPDLTSDALKKSQEEVVSAITSHTGSIKKTDDWGRKIMSYRIQKHDEAVYVIYTIMLESTKSKDLENAVKHVKGVMRHLFVLANSQEK